MCVLVLSKVCRGCCIFVMLVKCSIVPCCCLLLQVHSDNPKGLVKLMLPSLKEVAQ